MFALDDDENALPDKAAVTVFDMIFLKVLTGSIRMVVRSSPGKCLQPGWMRVVREHAGGMEHRGRGRQPLRALTSCRLLLRRGRFRDSGGACDRPLPDHTLDGRVVRLSGGREGHGPDREGIEGNLALKPVRTP